jgi:hypothetical protein
VQACGDGGGELGKGRRQLIRRSGGQVHYRLTVCAGLTASVRPCTT